MKLYVKVKPNSKEEKIERISENNFLVYLKEPAEDNRANKELINLLAKEFNVNFRKINIKNPKSRDKIVEIR